MNNFLDRTPVLEIVLNNPFYSRRYPESGTVLAIMDTGYEGFVAIPNDVFESSLWMDRLQQETAELSLANGKLIESRGSYATLTVPSIPISLDGMVETYDGMDEIIIGSEFLSHFKTVLDYCYKKTEFIPCFAHHEG